MHLDADYHSWEEMETDRRFWLHPPRGVQKRKPELGGEQKWVCRTVSISINEYFRTLNWFEIQFTEVRNKLSFILAKQRYPHLITLSLHFQYFHLQTRQLSNGTGNEYQNCSDTSPPWHRYLDYGDRHSDKSQPDILSLREADVLEKYPCTAEVKPQEHRKLMDLS